MAVLIYSNRRSRIHFSRILAARRSRVRLDDVHDAARVHIGLRYLVGVGKGLGCARSQFKGLAAQVDVVVNQLAGLHRHVAFILHNDCVGDLGTSLIDFGRVRALRDAQLCRRFFSSDSCRCADFSRIVAACCSRVRLDDVHNAACVDVSLRYSVGVGEGCFLTRSQGEGLAAQVGVVVF